MAEHEVIDLRDISDDEDERGQSDRDEQRGNDIDRRAILTPLVTRVVNALGGWEGEAYVLGDEVLGCLKDLKKLWRKDDTDDDRTVARIFWETRVLPNDLVPILMATAGKGMVEDRRAIACVDLMTAMTWPIDVAEELKELDEELDRAADYTQLLESHLAYKASLLRPGVMKALFAIMLPPLAKSPRERVERDGQIMNVVLHLIRNLAFIKDPPLNSLASADQAERAMLQSKLIRVLDETKILKLLLTIAANTDNDPLFNGWNTLVLETFYLLFRGVKPMSLAKDQTKEPTAKLQSLLALEDRNRREVARKASSRHSRFGTTITVKLNSKTSTAEDGTAKSLILHRQQAIHSETGSILDMKKRQKAKKGITTDAIGQEHSLSVEAKSVLQKLAGDFLEGCFNPFLAGLLKDIRSERAKVTEKDNLRLLYVTKWFLEFFLTMRAQAVANKDTSAEEKWEFGLIAEVTERTWIVWVLKRMREAMEEKPKQWTELQAGIECLTQLLLLISSMSSSTSASLSSDLQEAAEILQQQLIYNGEVLDISLESLKSYKEGTQSLVYLDSSVHLAYSLLRMLEKWAKEKGDGTYVRRRRERRRKKKGITEEEGIPDVEEEPEEVEDVVHETLFTFEAFESKFANADVANTLLIYLGRYKEFTSSEQMKRVVGLMHRQAVKAKAEGLFFKVSTLDLFKGILADQKSFPRDQAYKDLVNLVNFLLRRFFKALEEEPFLAVEAFFPKNRGHWKQFSSWEPEKKDKGARAGRKEADAKALPAEVQVKKGFSSTDQIGIAIAALVDAGRTDLVNWTLEILKSVIDKRERIVKETDQKVDGGEDQDDEDEEIARALRLKAPSAEAITKFEDEVIPYLSNDHAENATKNPHLKLLFRLCKFFVRDEDQVDEDDELEWYIPQAIIPSELQQTHNIISQFLATPFDLGGKKLSELLRKKRATRRRRRRSPSASDEEGQLSDEDETTRKKRQKKVKEQVQYKSAQFIEDSDEEYGDMDAFLEREKVQREKAALAAAMGGGTTDRPIGMRATGTKKRKRRNKKDEGTGNPSPSADADIGGAGRGPRSSPSRSISNEDDSDSASDSREGSDSGDRDDDGLVVAAPHAAAKLGGVSGEGAPVASKPRPKPRPVPRRKKITGVRSSSRTPVSLEDPDRRRSPHGGRLSGKEGGDSDTGERSPRVASPLGDDEVSVKAARRAKRLVLDDSDEE